MLKWPGLSVAVRARFIRSDRTFDASGPPKLPERGWTARSITPPMLNALCDRLLEKPHIYQDEMVVFFWDEFDVLVTTFSISRALASVG